jgi:hypothetical protein
MKIKYLVLVAFLIFPYGKVIHGETDVNNAQAMFIYSFLSHVQFPAGSVGSKYTVGILGKTTTTDYLRKYTNQRLISNKPIEIVEYNSSSEVNNCQLLFLAYNKSSEISAVDQKTKGKGCLIVAEKSGLSNAGAVIDFNIVDGKLRYKINEENAKKQNLLISSQLIQLSIK